MTVDRNGQVYLPRVGTLNVAGLRYEQLDGYLHAALTALFKDFELNVALGQLLFHPDFCSGQCPSARRLHPRFIEHPGQRAFCLRGAVGNWLHAPYSAAAREPVAGRV